MDRETKDERKERMGRGGGELGQIHAPQDGKCQGASDLNKRRVWLLKQQDPTGVSGEDKFLRVPLAGV